MTDMMILSRPHVKRYSVWGFSDLCVWTNTHSETLLIFSAFISVIRHRWDADARVQTSHQLQPATVPVCCSFVGLMLNRISAGTKGQDLFLVAGGTGGGMCEDLIIVELHMDVTGVDGECGEGDQRHWILNGRLNGMEILFRAVWMCHTGEK